MRVHPEHDGAFISLKIGGIDMGISGMMSAKDTLMENYIIIQARICIIGFSVEIDLSVIPGKMEDGGGIYFSFLFKWELGGIPLMEIGGFLDLIPLDIEGLLGISIFETILDMQLMVGIYIKPHIINYILMVIEFVIKAALSVLMLPLLLAIVIIQYVCIALQFILEKCIQGVRDMQRFVMLVARRVNAKLKKMEDREKYLQKLEDRVDGELSLMSDPGFCELARRSIAQGKCSGVHRSKFCDFKLVKRSPQPLAGGVLRTSTRPTLNLHLILPVSV